MRIYTISEKEKPVLYSKVDLTKNQQKKPLASFKASEVYIQFLFICHFNGMLVRF